MKRVLSIAVALMMVFQLSVVVFAEGTEDFKNTYCTVESEYGEFLNLSTDEKGSGLTV